MSKRVLILGANGFLGRHLAASLAKVARVTTVGGRAELDLSDTAAVGRFFALHTPFDVIFFCAAVGGLRARPDAAADYRANIDMVDNVRGQMGPGVRLVHYTSGAALDRSTDITAESTPGPSGSIDAAVDPYGAAKLQIERTTRADPRVTHVRIFGCFGPGETEFRFLTAAARAAAAGVPIVIREDRPFSYCSIGDVVRHARDLVCRNEVQSVTLCDAGVTRLSEWAALLGATPLVLGEGRSYAGAGQLAVKPAAIAFGKSLNEHEHAVVFGGTGAIGAAVVAHLEAQPGWTVTVVRHHDANDPAWPPRDLPGCTAVVWAGGDNVNDDAAGYREADLDRVLEANCKFVLRTAQRLHAAGKIAYAARLCIVSSIWQLQTRPGKLSYTVSKAAVGGAVRAMAADFAERAVLVNAVLPGAVDNAMTRATMPAEAQAAVRARTGFGRLVTEAEVARAVWGLVGSYTGITGQSIPVDLGFTTNAGV